VSEAKIVVKLIRSPIGEPGMTKKWVAGLGLKRPNKTVILPDTPPVRGMLAKVPHMVEWKPLEGKKPARGARTAGKKPAAGRTKDEAPAAAEATTGIDKETKDHAE
jgi:large subunit ribosomal protein L30